MASLLAEAAPRDAAQAYAIQDRVYAEIRRGRRPGAWKVGGPSDRVEPAASPILDLLRSPARVEGPILGVEAELAYRFVRDVEDNFSEERIASAVGEALVAIEVCATRLANWNEAPELWKLADFQSNGCLVAGSGRREWRRIDFSAQEVEMLVDGRVVVSKASHPYGDPFRLVPWLAAHCANRGCGLRAGDIVTTGSWGGMQAAAPGSTVVARFPGIGEARLIIVRA